MMSPRASKATSPLGRAFQQQLGGGIGQLLQRLGEILAIAHDADHDGAAALIGAAGKRQPQSGGDGQTGAGGSRESSHGGQD